MSAIEGSTVPVVGNTGGKFIVPYTDSQWCPLLGYRRLCTCRCGPECACGGRHWRLAHSYLLVTLTVDSVPCLTIEASVAVGTPLAPSLPIVSDTGEKILAPVRL